MFKKILPVSALAFAAVMGTAAFAQSVAPELNVETLTSVDMDGYATTMGTILGGLLATIIVVALAFVVIKKGFRALATWIKA